MRHRNELDIERTEMDPAARGHHRDRNFRRIALGGALGLEQRRAELRRIDRAFQSWPEIDDGTKVVFMGVRQHQAIRFFRSFYSARPAASVRSTCRARTPTATASTSAVLIQARWARSASPNSTGVTGRRTPASLRICPRSCRPVAEIMPARFGAQVGINADVQEATVVSPLDGCAS